MPGSSEAEIGAVSMETYVSEGTCMETYLMETYVLMADRPQDYVTPNCKVTTNSIEGFHGMALKYRSNRIDLKHAHYCCKST